MQLRSKSCDQMMLKNVLNTQNVTDDLKTKNQLRHVIRKKLKIPKHRHNDASQTENPSKNVI